MKSLINGRDPAFRHQVPMEARIWWEQFRNRMRARRIALGLLQRDVSERMGRSTDYVGVLENSDSVPNMMTAMLWVQALDGTLMPSFGEEDHASATRDPGVE